LADRTFNCPSNEHLFVENGNDDRHWQWQVGKTPRLDGGRPRSVELVARGDGKKEEDRNNNANLHRSGPWGGAAGAQEHLAN
jgi:hypothetical protein